MATSKHYGKFEYWKNRYATLFLTLKKYYIKI